MRQVNRELRGMDILRGIAEMASRRIDASEGKLHMHTQTHLDLLLVYPDRLMDPSPMHEMFGLEVVRDDSLKPGEVVYRLERTFRA